MLNDLKSTSLRKYDIVSDTKVSQEKLRPNKINGGYPVPDGNGNFFVVNVEYWNVEYAWYSSIGIRSSSLYVVETLHARAAFYYKFKVLGAIMDEGEVYGETNGNDTDYTSSTLIFRFSPWWANGHLEMVGGGGYLHGHVDYQGQRYYGYFL